MGLEATPTNLIQLIGAMTPLFISFSLLGASILNRNIKGLIFMGGVFFAYILNIIISKTFRVQHHPDRAMSCSIIETGLGGYSVPSWNSVFIAFTIAYMFLPMFFTGSMNYGVLVALAVLFGLDGVTKLGNKCTNPLGIVAGGLFGLVIGCIWYGIIKMSGNPQLLYFEELSNGEVCSRPSKQTFKCAVYKNGKLIKNL